MNMSLLDIRGIDVFYGDVQVVYDLSLTVNEGEVVSIIGGNGAGKSTLLRTISGLLRPAQGRSSFRASPCTRACPRTSSRPASSTSPKDAACFRS
jgi:branched-chain amino acid transport system ATP-binding protein